MEILKLDEKFLDILINDLDKYDGFWNEKILRDEFENENSEYYVLVKENDVLGFGGLWFNIDEAHVMNIAVKENLRRNGYGAKILDFLIGRAKERGKECITLEVREDNIAAIRLYEKLEFVVTGRRKRYYDNRVDAVIMSRVL